MTVVDEIKARVDIVDLVSESVQLRRAGRSFKALCPFHTEKTPSFVVDPARGTWRCFGACSEGGDIFSWVMRGQGVEFREALGTLAERAGVRLTPLDAHAEEREKRIQRLRSANEAAAIFYRRTLREEAEADEARAYVERRGVAEETAAAFGLGFAPAGAEALRGYLSARGFSGEEMAAAGLSVEGEGRARDRFRGRLVFPIRDARARCVGFGARALEGGDVKYLNTPQTELFDKSGLLYGLDQAQEAIRNADRVIVVEGYMDVIAAHQHEQRHVVASMGTALTERQVALIKPLTRQILLALDADAAGVAATVRGIDTTRQAVGTEPVPVVDARGIVRMQDSLAADIRIIELPPGRDPDDLIRLDPERWTTLVQGARGYLEYRFQQAAAARDLDQPRERAALMDELLPLVSAIGQPVVRAEYRERLAQLCRLEASALPLRSARAEVAPPHLRREASRDGAPARAVGRDPQGDYLLRLLLLRPEVAAEIGPEVADLIRDAPSRELLAFLCTSAHDTGSGAEGGGGAPPLPDHLAEVAAELRASAQATLPPYPPAEALAAARQAVSRLRERRLYEAARLQAQLVAEQQRSLGALTLHEAAYDMDEAGIDPATDRDAPAAHVLKSRAQGQALHARRADAAATEPAAAEAVPGEKETAR